MSEKCQKSEYKLYLEISLNLFLLSYLTKNKKNVKRAHCKINPQSNIFFYFNEKTFKPAKYVEVWSFFSKYVQKNLNFWNKFWNEPFTWHHIHHGWPWSRSHWSTWTWSAWTWTHLWSTRSKSTLVERLTWAMWTGMTRTWTWSRSTSWTKLILKKLLMWWQLLLLSMTTGNLMSLVTL